MTPEATIKAATKLIHKKFPKAKIFLFGSRVRGIARKYSDIDIGILSTNKFDIRDYIDLKEELENLNSFYPVELVDLSKSQTFREKVLAYAKQLL